MIGTLHHYPKNNPDELCNRVDLSFLELDRERDFAGASDRSYDRYNVHHERS